jgi:hypothetical protein
LSRSGCNPNPRARSAVQPGRARNLVDLLDTLAGLNHDKAQDAVSHDGNITGVHDHGGPDRAEGPVAARGIAAGRHRGGGFRAIAHHRHDDALHPGVEGLADDPGLVHRHTRERNGGTPAFDGAQHFDHFTVVHQPMLLIDTDVIDAADAH